MQWRSLLALADLFVINRPHTPYSSSLQPATAQGRSAVSALPRRRLENFKKRRMDSPPPVSSGQASVSSPARMSGGGGGPVLAPHWSPARVARTARDRVRSQRCQSPSPAPGPNNRPTGPLSGGPGKTRANLRSRRACLATRTRPSGQNGNASPRPSKVAALSGPLQNPGLRVGSARAPGTSAESASFGATDL